MGFVRQGHPQTAIFWIKSEQRAHISTGHNYVLLNDWKGPFI